MALSFASLTIKAQIVKISGEVTKPLSFSAADLSMMKKSEAVLKDRDGKEQRYTGVALQRILEAAGATTGKALRGEHLSK